MKPTIWIELWYWLKWNLITGFAMMFIGIAYGILTS